MEETIQVGKYTLESLTTGMYSDPKIIYREYIQNSVDALETAVKSNLIEPQSMRIDIIVDAENAYISIRDNGTGINSASAVSRLIRYSDIFGFLFIWFTSTIITGFARTNWTSFVEHTLF